jgi:photosystem II stability/assembly factor-like uncharacterized protein
MMRLAVCLGIMVAATVVSLRQSTPQQFEPQAAAGNWKWWFTPLEENIAFRSPVTRADLRSVFFLPGQNQVGWAVGENGTILHTENGGSRWQIESSGTSKDLRSVTFATPRSGWAVGEYGVILHTEDAGNSWHIQSNLTQEDLRSVAFTTPQSGWAVGDTETLHTENGGYSWQTEGTGTLKNLRSVTFATPQSGWAVGDTGTILYTENGGSRWQTESSGTLETLFSVTFATPQSGWAVGTRGTILHTENGGSNWQAQGIGTADYLYSVIFATAQSGWAVGMYGTVLHTANGGRSWQTQSGGITYNQGSSFPRAWSIEPHRRWPAPWYYATLAVCLAGLLWASLTVQPTNVPYTEDVANSNNPVAHLKGDMLGYRPMVVRLLRFIQNPNTAPPLVLSIQAPWGMGKSSVMRMLQSELQDKRAAATVWFNAWHHQKEDHLLAYLLEAIQKRVAPLWLSPVGIGFRFNLLRVRMFASIERFLTTLVALAALIFHSRIAEYISARISPWLDANKSHPQISSPLSLFLVLSVGLAILLNQVRAFSADPQKLLESSTRSVWRFLRDLFVFPSLQGKTDVRQEFEKNLQEVTDALRPQRLVIFLDDLDRCRPEQVVQILEAINFLSSAAPCFIIVGADYSKVETLVGMQFEHLAVQERENAGADKPDAAETRLHYARSYMKKVVNIRLNLPRPDPGAWKKLLGQPAERLSNTSMRWQQAVLAAVLLLCVSAVVATAMGWTAVAPSGQATEAGTTVPDKRIAPDNLPDARPAPTPNQTSGITVRPPEKPTETTQATAVEDWNPVDTMWSNLLTIGGVSLMALIFLVIVFRRPKEIEKAVDSKEFVETLKRMAKDVYKRNDTPREMRRFLNYLRLVAAPDDPAKGQPASEAGLVRLAATGLFDSQEDPSVIELFKERCDMFGLDPQTFTPKDEREKEPAERSAVTV